MLRCDRPAGTFEVGFSYLDSDGNLRKDEYIAPCGPHQRVFRQQKSGDLFFGENAPPNSGAWDLVEDVPYTSNVKPFVGELCACELAFMRALPGKQYSVHWRYDVRDAKEGS